MSERVSITEKLGRVWTAAVAYVALVAGAGLSIIFNVVDVVTVRGALVDRWDVLTAVAFPALVVLMVEMFVSTLWIGQPAAMQWLRWLGTISIGGIAMRVSWTHGHDFFLARGQATDVANLGPIAVDLLAIMATALILSGRSRSAGARARLAVTELAQAAGDTLDTLATGRPAGQYVAVSLPDSGPAVELGQDTDKGQDTDNFTDADASWLESLSARMGQTDSVPAVPVVTPAPRVSRVPAPTELDSAVDGLLSAGVSHADIKRIVSDHYQVSTKTVGRRIASLLDSAG